MNKTYQLFCILFSYVFIYSNNNGRISFNNFILYFGWTWWNNIALSTIGSFSIVSMLGIKQSLISAEVVPFLVLAIGVDNIFYNNWKKR